MTVSRDEVGNYTRNYFKAKLIDGDLTKKIGDLGLDSLDLVEFLMALEEHFGTEINADEIGQDMTLEDLCELLAK